MHHWPRVALGVSGVLVILLIPLAVLVGWPMWAGHQLDKVAVSWAGPPRCTGTTVRNEEVEDRVADVVVARPSMHCVIAVRIANRGDHQVTVTKVIAWWLGAISGAPVIGAPLDGVEPRPEPSFGIAAVYDIGAPLAAGATKTVNVPFVYRPQRCSGGGRFWDTHWPLVEVSAFGESAERSPSKTFCVRDYEKSHHCRARPTRDSGGVGDPVI